MKTETIKHKGKTIARVYLQNTSSLGGFTKHRFVASLVKDITHSEVGYAGFKTKQGLRKYVEQSIFEKNKKKIAQFSLDERKILSVLREVIVKCAHLLPAESVRIFIFPTFSDFVKQRMSGTTGYTPWRNTVLAFIHPFHSPWGNSLARTIAHEFNHSVFLRHNRCISLLDILVFEGLAEHFCEYVVGGKRAPWTKVLTLTQSRRLLVELHSKGLLDSTNQTIRRSVFFGNREYPLWAGYTLGYFIVKSFLKYHSSFTWENIMGLSGSEIFERSRFLQKIPPTE